MSLDGARPAQADAAQAIPAPSSYVTPFVWFTLCALMLLAWALLFRYDGWLIGQIGAFAPEASVTRRILKLSRWVFWWPTAAVALAIALRQGNRRRLVISVALTLLIGAALLYTLKNAIGRARPDEHLGAYEFQPFGFIDGFDSFPSGHTMTYFIFAILVGLSFPKLRHALFVAAALAAMSRIAQERHFGTDIIGGVLLAVVSVRIATTLSNRIDVTRIPIPRLPTQWHRNARQHSSNPTG